MVRRLVGWVDALLDEAPDTTVVTAGNILGTGNWELPVNFDAAAMAASHFDVMVSRDL